MQSPEHIQELLLHLGSQETSATPHLWTQDNPLMGHCAVVALLIQSLYGGELLQASLENTPYVVLGSHYWNRLSTGEEVDFTQSQFEDNKPILLGETRTRAYILSFEDTKRRYEILKRKFEQEIT